MLESGCLRSPLSQSVRPTTGTMGDRMSETQTHAFDGHFDSYQRRLSDDFSRLRQSLTSSAAKGARNEQLVADFFSRHFPSAFVLTRAQIVDADGRISLELDVCVCNDDQPFQPDSTDVLIAEGVDFVVEVKARLDGGEIRRIVDNCRSVKKLIRRFEAGSLTMAWPDDIPYRVERIPYFALAFESQLDLITVRDRLFDELKDVPFEHQPDALFIIDRGGIINQREGRGVGWKEDETTLKGLCSSEFGADTVMELMRFVYLMVPRIHRNDRPFYQYFPVRERQVAWINPDQ